jgi:tetratricopeptide (TPR) repeat protein
VERPELKLVTAGPAGPKRPAAFGLGAAVLVAAGVATICGADAARRPFDPAPLAESALARSLATNDPEPVREARDLLDARLRANPLDSVSRTIAASLLVESATTDVLREAAVAQATAAVRLTPFDASVARRAARVLARCGRSDLALEGIAKMFGYAPGSAAATLSDIEPFVAVDRLEAALPPLPEAWLAWSVRLRLDGRHDEADARLTSLLARWPANLEALSVAASVAAGRGRYDELLRLVPPSLPLPATPETAELHAFRARSKAAAGDAAGARADALSAIALSNESPWVMAAAGDVFEKSDPVLARDYWTRALYRLLAKPGTRGGAIHLRYRLARLDEREGRAGDALREWRTILAERPDDAEARRRVAALTGESPP